MQTFVDQQQREWRVEVNTWSVKQVRDQLGVLLPALFDDEYKLLVDLSTDYVKLIDVCWVLCEAQAAERQLTPEQFYGSMSGDSLRAALEALGRATADFFTSPEQRQSLHQIVDLVTATTRRVVTLAEEQLARTLATLDTDQLARNCLDFVLSGPASPVSNRGVSPPANSA